MGRRKSLNEKLMEFKRNASNSLYIQKMILFGSRAEGKTGKDTDIDLIIVSPKFRKLDFFQRGAEMYEYWNLDCPVDFLCYTPEEFNKMKNMITIVREAVKQGVEIK